MPASANWHGGPSTDDRPEFSERPGKNKSVTQFENLIQPTNDAWTKLLVKFKELFRNRDAAIVYGLPEALVESLAEHVPGLFNDDELSFERQLSDSLRHHSVALTHGGMIRSSLFEERAPMIISSEDVRSLGWEKYGLTTEKANTLAAELESRGRPFHEQAVAYAGWLVTNTCFLGEVAAIRKTKREHLTKTADGERAYLFDSEMNAFCARWQLAGMTSWDLPEPQGPNLAGIPIPQSARRGSEQVNLELPLTMRLPARVPIRDIVTEIRTQTAPSQLAEWQEILDRKGGPGPGPGLSQFRTILKIQFFRNIVLGRRYGQRFSGIVEALDRAFGKYLELGEDSIKKLRLEIQRRLGPS